MSSYYCCREELEFIANTLIFILAGVIIAGNIYLSQHTPDSPVQIAGQDYGYAILLWVVLLVSHCSESVKHACMGCKDFVGQKYCTALGHACTIAHKRYVTCIVKRGLVEEDWLSSRQLNTSACMQQFWVCMLLWNLVDTVCWQSASQKQSAIGVLMLALPCICRTVILVILDP